MPATPKPERFRFPKSAHLRDGREFSRVRESGKAVQGRLLRLAIYCPLARTNHSDAAHLANHLAASPVGFPHQITADMLRSAAGSGDQSVTQSEPPPCDLSGLAEGAAKVGIITSKRVGGAVVRNRVRRRLRELVRHSLAHFPPGSLIVVIAKTAAAAASFEELRREWLLLGRRLSILPPLA